MDARRVAQQIESKPIKPLRFDRRSGDRWAAIGRLRAFIMDAPGRSRALDLELVDEGEGGLSADTDEPLAPGARLDVCTSPDRDGWRAARVVRCLPNGHGYRVGLAYELRRAA